MRALPKAYLDAAKAGDQEVYLSVITTVKGRYLYSEGFPTDSIRDAFGSVDFWNGVDATLGDGGTWGAIPVIEFGARLLSPGTTKNTIAPQENRLLISLAQTERGSITSEYDNSDSYFSVLLGDQRDDPFIAQIHELYHGFVGLSGSDFIKTFQGEIHDLDVDSDVFTLITEGQSVVYPQTDTEEGLTAYALLTTVADADTYLLIHSNTTDGSTTFIDSSQNAHTITTTGTVEHKTAQQKFGTSSILSTAAINNYLSVTRLQPGTGDFTIETWMYLTSTAISYALFQTAWNPACWAETYSSNTGVRVGCGTSGSGFAVQADSFTFLNTWVLVTVERYNGTLYLYFQGNIQDSAANTADLTGAADALRINATNGNQSPLAGYLDEIRFSTVARYQGANFTPPTAPYQGLAGAIMVQDTFTHAALASVFFASDDWTCNINFTKDALGSAGVLFSLENNGTVTTLEIGIDVNNFAYVVTGQSVEGVPATTTYTDTTVLTAAMIANNLNLFISYSDTNSEITFRINGYSATQAAAVPYDRTGTNSEQVTIGDDWGGKVLNVKFNTTFFATNNEGDDGLAAIPDVIGAHDLTLVDASWEAW